MKLIGSGALGLIVGYIVYMVLLVWVYDPYLSKIGGWLGGWNKIPFLILLPFSLLLGGILAGILSCFIVTSKWSLLLAAPGLYLIIFVAGMLMPSSTSTALVAFSLVLYWYVASLVGVGLRYFLTSQFLH